MDIDLDGHRSSNVDLTLDVDGGGYLDGDLLINEGGHLDVDHLFHGDGNLDLRHTVDGSRYLGGDLLSVLHGSRNSSGDHSGHVVSGVPGSVKRLVDVGHDGHAACSHVISRHGG